MAKENHGTVKAPLVRHSKRLNNQSRFLQSPLYNLLHAQAKIYADYTQAYPLKPSSFDFT